MARDKLEILESWVQDGLRPDLTLLFDVPTEVAQVRLAGTGVAPDRFEQEQQAFFERVRQAYLDRVGREPERMIRIDSTRPLDIIKKQLEDIVITF